MQNVLKLDLNNPSFQSNLLDLDKAEWSQLRTTFKKLRQMSRKQVYPETGLKWENVTSIESMPEISAAYLLRVSQSCRALASRDGDFMRLLTVSGDHDAVYDKK